MALGGLGAAVGRAVAPQHLRRAVAEEMLDIELAGVVGDGPGGERVPKAVGVNARDARGPAEASQQQVQAVAETERVRSQTEVLYTVPLFWEVWPSSPRLLGRFPYGAGRDGNATADDHAIDVPRCS